jgi:hypothetical protein
VAENLYDTNQLFAQYFVPNTDNELPSAACSFVRDFSTSMVQTLQQVISAPADQTGLFAPSCFNHGLVGTELIQNQKFSQVFGDWYFQRANANFPSYKALDPCHNANDMGCNPSCAAGSDLNFSKCNIKTEEMKFKQV